MLIPTTHRGGLAPWQRRHTLDLIEHHLRGDLRLARLAGECRLSTSYYCRCFRVSFGTSVHQFVIRRRVERAKELLMRSSLALAEIAAEAGFSDQAAFSRTFAASVGDSPARWRAQHRLGPPTLVAVRPRMSPTHREPHTLNFATAILA